MADRVKEALEAFIRRVTSRLDYCALYPARVAKQNSDGSLELVPDDERLPGLSRVPIRYGLPGARATLEADSRVAIGFENSDPSRPVVVFWEQGAVSRLELTASEIVLNGGSAKVARVGDDVAVDLSGTTLTGTIGGSPATFTVTGGSAAGEIASGADGVKA